MRFLWNKIKLIFGMCQNNNILWHGFLELPIYLQRYLIRIIGRYSWIKYKIIYLMPIYSFNVHNTYTILCLYYLIDIYCF